MTAAPVARLDAEVLRAHVLGCERGALFARDREPLTPEQRDRLGALMARRAAGEPLAYLTGVKEFWSLTLKVTPDVLIPRPETELLVEWTVEKVRAGAAAGRILDLGTGSGAIALALAHELPGVRITATDVAPKALAVARENAARHAVGNVDFVQGRWFDGLLEPPFEIIVSNPPYVAEHDPHLAELGFEPALALTSGADGLDAIREILAGAARYLAPGGWLLLEHGAQQGAAVRELFAGAGLNAIETRRDLAGLERATAGARA